MGYDIYIKQCSSIHCKLPDCSHTIIDESYISYNFNKFRNYWSVTENLHSHTGSFISSSLHSALEKLSKEGIHPHIKKSEDGWTPSKNVFAFHLLKLKTLAEKYPDYYFYIDGHSDSEFVIC
jgi:hypothetical protein